MVKDLPNFRSLVGEFLIGAFYEKRYVKVQEFWMWEKSRCGPSIDAELGIDA